MRNLTQIMHEKLRAVYFDTMAFKLKKKMFSIKCFRFFFIIKFPPSIKPISIFSSNTDSFAKLYKVL